MADPTALYSYRGNEPSLLPHEISWVEEWGQITYRTDVNSFTDEELEKAGYFGPVEVPSISIDYERLKWDSKKIKYIVEEISEEELWEKIRKERNRRLAECDWTMAADAPQNLNFREWEMYRERLRNLPSQYKHPKDVIWPISPEGRPDTDFDQPRIIESRLRWRVDDLEKTVKKIIANLMPEPVGIASTTLDGE